MFLDVPVGHETRLTPFGGPKDQVHVFDDDTIQAVNAALAAQRPLLVRGEPGSGKSQMARAVAVELKRAYIQYVMDARTESRYLLWHFDAVGRLAQAQYRRAAGEDREVMESELAVEKFLRPGPLWWAFHWESAESKTETGSAFAPATFVHKPAGWTRQTGCVLLIDEIDKAEPDVPNGLLEALGNMQFTPFGRTKPVTAEQGDAHPFVVITSNEERALPDAFVRRCLCLTLILPETGEEKDQAKETAFVDWFVNRGRAHFPDAAANVLEEAARQLRRDRRQAEKDHLRPLPGQAEYIDLLRAVRDLAPGDEKKQLEKLKQVSRFVLKKHARA